MKCMVALFKSHVVSFYALASLECELSPCRTQEGVFFWGGGGGCVRHSGFQKTGIGRIWMIEWG